MIPVSRTRSLIIMTAVMLLLIGSVVVTVSAAENQQLPLTLSAIFYEKSCDQGKVPLLEGVPMPLVEGVKISLYATKLNTYIDLSKAVHLGTFTSDDEGLFSAFIDYNSYQMKGNQYIIMIVEPPAGYSISCEQLNYEDNKWMAAMDGGNWPLASRQGDRIILDVHPSNNVKPFGNHDDRFWLAKTPPLVYAQMDPGAIPIISTGAQSGPVISVGSAQGKSGTVKIPVSVSGAETIGNMDISVDHSACTGLRYAGSEPGSLTQNSLTSAKDNGNHLNIAIIDPAGITGGGSLVYLSYDILSASAPSCSLGLSVVEGNRVDGSVIQFAKKDGSFSSGSLKGDSNKDGVITSVDALMAVQMATGALPADLIADMNGDGKVTSIDASQILKMAGANPAGSTGISNSGAAATPSPEGSPAVTPDSSTPAPTPERTMKVVRMR